MWDFYMKKWAILLKDTCSIQNKINLLKNKINKKCKYPKYYEKYHCSREEMFVYWKILNAY